ncbi:MAG: sn-glycerol-1-phosphate dehydrogenase [Leptolinea sp.]
MENERINAALREATDTRSIVIGVGALSSVEAVFTQCFNDKQAVVVADENTFKVAGDAVYQQLISAGHAASLPLIFPGQPTLYADYENVQRVEDFLREIDAIPVVVGSGTLNDLTKLAAHRLGRPYMIVATAASMDGYTAFGAAISKDGYKQTFSCPAPYALLADLEIIANAPVKMTTSGYGDLIGKVFAGADWMIADALGIETIHQRSWSLIQESIRKWTANPQLLQQGNVQAIENLIEGLVMCGLSLQIFKSSRPASGAEHLISHLWEMQETTHGVVSHGLKVGLGSIATAALFEQLLKRDLKNLNINTICKNWPTREQYIQNIRQSHSNPVLADIFVEQSMSKYLSADQLPARLELIQSCWPRLREQLQAQLMTAEQVSGLLQAAGGVITPSGIGKDMSQLKSTYFLARQIRSRYTLFDLAAETGCLEACVEELFSPGGYWAKNAEKGN